MKRLLLLVVLFSFVACEGFLNVNPRSQVLGDELLDSPEGFEDALYGVYASMRSESLYGGQLTHLSLDILAQYFKSPGNTYIPELNSYKYTDVDVEEIINTVWGDMYHNIAMLNNILLNLEKTDENAIPLYKIYKGEALGLRAFLHFDLLRLFTEDIKINPQAKGIPYSTDFSSTSPEFISSEEVYEKIITDLEAAETLLTEAGKNYFPGSNAAEDYLADRNIHFNLYAVQATLARVYLTKGDMDNALKYAQKVIESNRFELLQPVNINKSLRGTIYPEETIFGLYDADYFEIVRDRFYQEQSFYSLDLKTGLVNEFNTNSATAEDRRKSYYFGLGPGSIGTTRFLKLVDQFRLDDAEYQRPDELISGINLIRLPEMYYIAAEALVRKNNVSEAREYLDPVLASRGLNPLAERTPEQFPTIEMITKERYKELIGEGQTFFNMKRLHLDIVDVYGQTVSASSDIFVWPIPDDEYIFRN